MVGSDDPARKAGGRFSNRPYRIAAGVGTREGQPTEGGRGFTRFWARCSRLPPNVFTKPRNVFSFQANVSSFRTDVFGASPQALTVSPF